MKRIFKKGNENKLFQLFYQKDKITISKESLPIKNKSIYLKNKTLNLGLSLGLGLGLTSINVSAATFEILKNNRPTYGSYEHDSSNIAVKSEVCGYGLVHKTSLEQNCSVNYSQSPFNNYTILNNYGFGTTQKKKLEEYLYGQYYYRKVGGTISCLASNKTYVEKTQPVVVKDCPSVCYAKMETLKQYYEYQSNPKQKVTVAKCPNGQSITAIAKKELTRSINNKELLLEDANECASWSGAFVDKGYDKSTINYSACSNDLHINSLYNLNVETNSNIPSNRLDFANITFTDSQSVYNYKKEMIYANNDGWNGYETYVLNRLKRDKDIIRSVTVTVTNNLNNANVPYGIQIRDEILNASSLTDNPYGIMNSGNTVRQVPKKNPVKEIVFAPSIGETCGVISVSPLDLSLVVDNYKPISCSNGKQYAFDDVNWRVSNGTTYDITKYIKQGYYPYPFYISKANTGNGAVFSVKYDVRY